MSKKDVAFYVGIMVVWVAAWVLMGLQEFDNWLMLAIGLVSFYLMLAIAVLDPKDHARLVIAGAGLTLAMLLFAMTVNKQAYRAGLLYFLCTGGIATWRGLLDDFLKAGSNE